MTNIYELCGYMSGMLFSFSLIPQVYKSYTTKNLDDISIYWQLLSLIGMIMMLIYSYHENLKPVFIPGTFEAICLLSLLIMKIKYHNKNIDLDNNDLDNNDLDNNDLDNIDLENP